jgi:hypothetical protein
MFKALENESLKRKNTVDKQTKISIQSSNDNNVLMGQSKYQTLNLPELPKKDLKRPKLAEIL